MPQRLYTREEKIRNWFLAEISAMATFAVENGLASKQEVRREFDEALEIASEPEPSDPGLTWGFTFSREEEDEEE